MCQCLAIWVKTVFKSIVMSLSNSDDCTANNYQRELELTGNQFNLKQKWTNVNNAATWILLKILNHSQILQMSNVLLFCHLEKSGKKVKQTRKKAKSGICYLQPHKSPSFFVHVYLRFRSVQHSVRSMRYLWGMYCWPSKMKTLFLRENRGKSE